MLLPSLSLSLSLPPLLSSSSGLRHHVPQRPRPLALLRVPGPQHQAVQPARHPRDEQDDRAHLPGGPRRRGRGLLPEARQNGRARRAADGDRRLGRPGPAQDAAEGPRVRVVRRRIARDVLLSRQVHRLGRPGARGAGCVLERGWKRAKRDA